MAGPARRHVLLVGMMGAGKTTVGGLLAERLGRPYCDSDLEVEAATGRSVAEIFADEGEAAFRAQESAALALAVAEPGARVISVAGGAVLAAANRALIEAAGLVVWLRARVGTLAVRVGAGEGRPLLGGDPAAALARLDTARRDLYAEVADLTIDVDDLTAGEVVDAVVAAMDAADAPAAAAARTADGARTGAGGLITVTVDLGERSYPVLVGAGARHRLLEVLPTGARRAAVITQAAVGVPVDPGVEHRSFLIGDGEESKSLETVEDLCRRLARWGLTRGDVIVAVGGGVVTDTAGFVAAVYHRGVAVIHVATTLLAQVDAAIGGKTGVNLPEG
ncbi:MAG TPA: shikimate kinase, partial [Acidimicrobiales bacterium]